MCSRPENLSRRLIHGKLPSLFNKKSFCGGGFSAMIVSHMIWSYTAWSRWSNYTFRILLYISEYIATIATTESTSFFPGVGRYVSFRHFIICKRCTMDLWLLISSPFMWAWVLAIAARNGTMANIDIWKTMENVPQKKRSHENVSKSPPGTCWFFCWLMCFYLIPHHRAVGMNILMRQR